MQKLHLLHCAVLRKLVNCLAQLLFVKCTPVVRIQNNATGMKDVRHLAIFTMHNSSALVAEIFAGFIFDV